MINGDIEKLIIGSGTSEVVNDIILLFVIFFFLWLFFRKRPVVFLILFSIIVIILTTNELLTPQEFTTKKDGDILQEVVITSKSKSPFRLSLGWRLLMVPPVIISGVIQTRNMLKGDKKYSLTKSLTTATIANSAEKVIFRTHLREQLPNKVIFLCQHVEMAIDVLTFHTFIPDSHKYTVFNDFTGNVLHPALGRFFDAVYCRHLYGARMLARIKKGEVKEQMKGIIDTMVVRNGDVDDKEVFCIWPSGKHWVPKFPNGVEFWKPGSFYLSAFTGIPVCIIYTKVSKDSKTIITEQSELIYPPKFENKEPNYVQFYDNPENKKLVEEYCSRVEILYRGIDNRLDFEVEQI